MDQGRTKESLSWATVGTEWGEGGEFVTRGSCDAVGKSYGCRISPPPLFVAFRLSPTSLCSSLWPIKYPLSSFLCVQLGCVFISVGWLYWVTYPLFAVWNLWGASIFLGGVYFRRYASGRLCLLLDIDC